MDESPNSRTLLALLTAVVLLLAIQPGARRASVHARSAYRVWLPVAYVSGAGPRDPDRLLATGQAFGYRGNHGRPSDGNRDDGDLIRGRLQRYEHDATTEPGTQGENAVLDRNTGLMWIRDVRRLDGQDGRGVGGNVRMDDTVGWQGALQRCGDLFYAGYDDWRLPNLKELQTLVDYGRAAWAIDMLAFPGELDAYPSPYFWTSTTLAAEPHRAFYVNFLNGHTYPFDKAVRLWLRPVRTAGTADPVAVLKTGQSTGYVGDVGRPGPGNGDDGDLRLGLEPSYEIYDDGAIDTPAENLAADNRTDLMWVRDPSLLTGEGRVGGNVALHEPIDWQTAIGRVNAMAYGGYDDWRMPNIVELTSMAQPGRDDGHLFDPVAFPNAADASGGGGARIVWWSSTSSAFDRSATEPGRDAAWYFGGAEGATNFIADDHLPAKSRPGYARPVRDLHPRQFPALYLEEVRASSDFTTTARASSRPDLLREGKFLLPSDELGAPFRAAYQDVHVHPLHYEFLVAAFPDHFAGLTPVEYTARVSRRSSRDYFAGGLKSFHDSVGRRVYGFDVYTDPQDAQELLDEDETAALYRQLARTFRRRPLVYSPARPAAVERARAWGETPFPIAYPAETAAPDYEAYTTGQTYGVVRRMTLAELDAAASDGRLSHQEIIVLDDAPIDLEGVVAGVVTGRRQGELSHLGVRTARRGTPNAYVRGSHDAFAPYEGRLVRLSVTRVRFIVESGVSRDEAEAWWAAVRPRPVAVRPADDGHIALDDLAAMGVDDADGRATTRFGGKAANLARLYSFLPPEHQVPGFGIPFRHYLDFMAGNTLLDAQTDPPVRRSYADYVAALHADPEFRADPVRRAERLDDLRGEMRAGGRAPEALVAELAARIDAVFGPGVMVRFRSSSNAEDGLEFNGAGLYDSTSVCAADSLDDDPSGPSRCDPNQPKERTIERGLKKVWASLWNVRAWEEREYYGMDHLAVGMAVLVTPAFPDERANGVAFTGVPSLPEEDDYLVNVQAGDVSVVLPDPGVLPERDLLTVEGGRVTRIRRQRPSSLVPPGTWVMSDAELGQLGGVMALADDRFPVETGPYERGDILLDLEFKVRRADDGLVVKQIRPFLKRSPGLPGQPASVRVHAPEPLALCGTWREGVGLRRELEEKARLQIRSIDFEVALNGSDVHHELFGALAFGPELTAVPADGQGSARIEAEAGDPAARRLVVTRHFRDGQREIEVQFVQSGLRADEFDLVWLDEPFLTWRAAITAVVRDTTGGPETARLQLAPCDFGELALYRFDVRLAEGWRAELWQRRERDDGLTGQAALVTAAVHAPQGSASVNDYRQLVYAADRHHWNERFWVRFDSPLGDAHGLGIYQRYVGSGDPTYSAELLDANLDSLRELAIVSVERTRLP